MRVYNPDGSEAEACGNGTRCVARLIMEEHGTSRARIETRADVLAVTAGVQGYTVDMGRPRFGWDEIPLAQPMDTLALDLALGPLGRPVALSMGNPHAVFLVDDAEAVPLEQLGPELEHHPLFPERANIGVAEVRDRAHDPPAGLGARRGPDRRLRQRRLRRPGRRGAPRPRRAQRRSAGRRRPPADRLERGGSRADDRPGEPQLRAAACTPSCWRSAHEPRP